MRARIAPLLVALAALALPAGAWAGEKVFVEPNLFDGPPQVRPHEIELSADGTLTLYGIQYDASYGGAVARATGRAYLRACEPDCARGKVTRVPAKIKLSGLTHCQGKLMYGQLQYTLGGRLPKFFRRSDTWDLRPVDDGGNRLC